MPYVKVDNKTLGPNNTIPDWDLTGDLSKIIPSTEPEQSKKNKRLASKSPEGCDNRNHMRNISSLQVLEFVWPFLKVRRQCHPTQQTSFLRKTQKMKMHSFRNLQRLTHPQ